MTTVTTPTAAVKATPAAVKTTPAAELPKPAVKAEDLPIIAAAPTQTPTIEERLEKFEQLQNLKKRRDQVQEAIDDLGDFQVSPTGGAELRLTDSYKRTFSIAHPLVISDMVGHAKAKLVAELANIDALFLL
jgi:hypothetical protein